jgi:hypothetical protein
MGLGFAKRISSRSVNLLSLHPRNPCHPFKSALKILGKSRIPSHALRGQERKQPGRADIVSLYPDSLFF